MSLFSLIFTNNSRLRSDIERYISSEYKEYTQEQRLYLIEQIYNQHLKKK